MQTCEHIPNVNSERLHLQGQMHSVNFHSDCTLQRLLQLQPPQSSVSPEIRVMKTLHSTNTSAPLIIHPPSMSLTYKEQATHSISYRRAYIFFCFWISSKFTNCGFRSGTSQTCSEQPRSADSGARTVRKRGKTIQKTCFSQKTF